MNILFSINAKFIDLTKTCIRSIIRFDKNIDFYILHHDLNQKHMDDLRRSFLECTFHFIEVKEEEFKGFPISSRYPLEIYYRLDIVVIQSLRELYNMDFESNLYIASSHVNERMTHLNAKRLGLKEDVPYINTGVLLMNLELLRKQLNMQDILNYVNAYKKNLVLFDQDVLTALYGDKTKLVDYRKYNLSERMMNFYNLRNPRSRIDLDWVKKNSVIIHYCGRMKPWNGKYIGCLDCFYRELEK